MDFEVTPEFVEHYDQLDDAQAACVDDAIRRVLADPSSAWARQNRIVGENGSAWLVVVRFKGEDFALYWEERIGDSPLMLLVLKQ